jgi:glutamyl-tRNA synthetase
MGVRVRYAPSPTGLQHIGGVRSALFNYFFARSQGGTFILRVEDTDRTRTTDDAMQDLYDTFAWLGVHWDEGPDTGGPHAPYVQSERAETYREYAARLVAEGHAYECFCSEARLERIRKIQVANKMAPGYDRHCRSLSPEEIAASRADGIKPVVRFKVPMEGSTVVKDVLLGEIERRNEDINPDPILLKSDGFPTYHLANVIDDHLMEITHILRAQEWIPSGPLHVLLYKAFGWEPPIYCHLPMVMGTDGQKLSKRHGSTSVREFRNAGYLPEALINYVALLGWSYDDTREFFTKEELEKVFSLERLNKAPAVFDYKKLDWFNGQYIRKRSPEDLVELIVPQLVRDGILSDPPAEAELRTLTTAMPLIQERMRVLGDAPDLVRFLFIEPAELPVADLIPKRLDAGAAIDALKTAMHVFDDGWTDGDDALEERFRASAEERGAKLGDVLMPVRVALTGTKVSPPLFGSARLLGKETVHKRLDGAIRLLESEVKA